jgi:hypothetical protein
VTVTATGALPSSQPGLWDITVTYGLTGADAANYTVSPASEDFQVEISGPEIPSMVVTTADDGVADPYDNKITLREALGVYFKTNGTVSGYNGEVIYNTGSNKTITFASGLTTMNPSSGYTLTGTHDGLVIDAKSGRQSNIVFDGQTFIIFTQTGAADVTIKAPRGRRTRTATDQELAEILAYARKTDPEHRLFILLLVYTGARGSTILALTPDSLDADQKLHMFNVKAKKRYDFPIQITNRDLLDTWKTVAKRGVLWLRKWHEVTFSAWLRRHFGKDASGEYLSAHSMRHTFATRALQSGVPLEIVSKLLDHASVSTTLSIYAKFSTEQIDNAVKCTVETIPGE